MSAKQDTVDVSENANPPSRPIPNSVVPQWLPISLLAVTSAALVVPIVLLRRSRANALSMSLQNSAAPPRRSGSSSSHLLPIHPTRSTPTTSQLDYTQKVNLNSQENFNVALYTAKAFGFATVLVAVGAISTVWGVKSALGVESPREFGQRMRSTILAKMPVLSARLHRPPDPSSPHIAATADSQGMAWNWPDAEERLKEAFDRGGISGWAVAAMRELEAEGRVERAKRKMDAAAAGKNQ